MAAVEAPVLAPPDRQAERRIRAKAEAKLDRCVPRGRTGVTPCAKATPRVAPGRAGSARVAQPGSPAPPTDLLAQRPPPWERPPEATRAAGATGRRTEPHAVTPGVMVDSIEAKAWPASRYRPYEIDDRAARIAEHWLADEPEYVEMPGAGTWRLHVRIRRGEHYPIMLRSESAAVFLNPRNGALKVYLASEPLWTEGAPQALRGLLWTVGRWWWGRLVGKDAEWRRIRERCVVTRADLCRDIEALKLGVEDADRFVTRARKTRQYRDQDHQHCKNEVISASGRLETLYLGKGSAITMRAYNKTQQLRDTGHEGHHYRVHWDAAEYGGDEVMRVEYQLRGERGLHTIETSQGQLDDIALWLDEGRLRRATREAWGYLTGSWATLRDPSRRDDESTITRLKRAPIDPRWERVQRLGDDAELPLPAQRVAAVRQRAQDETVAQKAALVTAHVTSLAAQFERIDATTSEELLETTIARVVLPSLRWDMERRKRWSGRELADIIDDKRAYWETAHRSPPLEAPRPTGN